MAGWTHRMWGVTLGTGKGDVGGIMKNPQPACEGEEPGLGREFYLRLAVVHAVCGKTFRRDCLSHNGHGRRQVLGPCHPLSRWSNR